MLNQNTIINYLKQNLGYPWSVLEMTDGELINYIQTYVLYDFSNYVPHKNKIGVDFSKEELKTEIPNERFFYDPEGCEVLDLIEIIFTLGKDVASGHPPIGIMDFSEMPNYVYNTERARNAGALSLMGYHYEFIPPNRIRIEPEYNEYATVVYERVHPKDFSTIPVFARQLFLDFCLGHIMLVLGRKRKKYSTIQTPYGEVALNGDDIKSEGQELIDKVKEKIELYNPGVIIDIG
jgi:hypothetical protein